MFRSFCFDVSLIFLIFLSLCWNVFIQWRFECFYVNVVAIIISLLLQNQIIGLIFKKKLKNMDQN
jgi:hypothetical protein